MSTATTELVIPHDAPARLTTSALARMLGVSTLTVRNLVRRGELPAPLRISDRICWFSTAAVRETLERRQRTCAG